MACFEGMQRGSAQRGGWDHFPSKRAKTTPVLLWWVCRGKIC